MTKKIYLETLKSVMGRSNLHYFLIKPFLYISKSQDKNLNKLRKNSIFQHF